MGGNDTWANALIYCDDLILDGYTDWYLPTVKEIIDMFDYSTGTCNSVFSGCSYYWSSTSMPSYPGYAYALDTGTGFIYPANKGIVNDYRARCVRFEN
jgi:hypothetical protein